MDQMRLFSVWFEVAGARPEGRSTAWPGSWYARQAGVLNYSARLNSPNWTVQVQKIGPPPSRPVALMGPTRISFIYNTHKLEHWKNEVMKAPEGEGLLLIDSDTMVLHPLDPIWDLDFDVAITTKRNITRIPLNGGVVFLRVNDRSRAFMECWWRWNLKLLSDARMHHRYRQIYAGMNQAALGAVLEKKDFGGAKVVEIPCMDWNCETACWKFFDPAKTPRIVHVKGGIRRALMLPGRFANKDAKQQAIMSIWFDLENQARAARKARKGESEVA